MKLTPDMLNDEDATPVTPERGKPRKPWKRGRQVEEETEEDAEEEEEEDDEEEDEEEVEGREPLSKKKILLLILVVLVGFFLFFIGIRGIVSSMSAGKADPKVTTEASQEDLDEQTADFEDVNAKRTETKADKKDAPKETPAAEDKKDDVTVDPNAKDPNATEEVDAGMTVDASASKEDQIKQLELDKKAIQQELATAKEQLAASQAREAQLQSQLGATAPATK